MTTRTTSTPARRAPARKTLATRPAAAAGPEVDDYDDSDVDGELIDGADEEEVDEAIDDRFVFATTPYTDEELDARKRITLSVDGQGLVAEEPDPGAFALLAQAISNSSTNADRYHAILNFAWGVFEEAGKMYIQNRLYDNSDSFTIEVLAGMVEVLLEEFSPDPQSNTNRAARRALDRKNRRNGVGRR